MSYTQAFVVGASLFLISLSSHAHAQQAGIALAIEKHAQLTETGGMLIRIHVSCGPFDGGEDFQEAVAGGGQARTGAEAEGGIDGTVVCDGVERVHTARMSSFSGARFRRGPAGANASLIVCMLLGEEQQCFNGGTERRVIIRGPMIP